MRNLVLVRLGVEERKYLFERDIRKKCGVMYEYPIVISTIDYGTESQWLQGFNKKYFYNLGGYYQDLYQNNFIIKFLWM